MGGLKALQNKIYSWMNDVDFDGLSGHIGKLRDPGKPIMSGLCAQRVIFSNAKIWAAPE